jgi:hypothetical protein
MFPNNKAWISVVDITPFFAVLSPNTPTAQIEQQVILAQTLDVKNELPKELIEDINNAILANPQQYRTNRTYVEGDKVFYNGVYYIALDAIAVNEAPPVFVALISANFFLIISLSLSIYCFQFID